MSAIVRHERFSPKIESKRKNSERPATNRVISYRALCIFVGFIFQNLKPNNQRVCRDAVIALALVKRVPVSPRLYRAPLGCKSNKRANTKRSKRERMKKRNEPLYPSSFVIGANRSTSPFSIVCVCVCVCRKKLEVAAKRLRARST